MENYPRFEPDEVFKTQTESKVGSETLRSVQNISKYAEKGLTMEQILMEEVLDEIKLEKGTRPQFFPAFKDEKVSPEKQGTSDSSSQTVKLDIDVLKERAAQKNKHIQSDFDIEQVAPVTNEQMPVAVEQIIALIKKFTHDTETGDQVFNTYIKPYIDKYRDQIVPAFDAQKHLHFAGIDEEYNSDQMDEQTMTRLLRFRRDSYKNILEPHVKLLPLLEESSTSEKQKAAYFFLNLLRSINTIIKVEIDISKFKKIAEAAEKRIPKVDKDIAEILSNIPAFKEKLLTNDEDELKQKELKEKEQSQRSKIIELVENSDLTDKEKNTICNHIEWEPEAAQKSLAEASSMDLPQGLNLMGIEELDTYKDKVLNILNQLQLGEKNANMYTVVFNFAYYQRVLEDIEVRKEVKIKTQKALEEQKQAEEEAKLKAEAAQKQKKVVDAAPQVPDMTYTPDVLVSNMQEADKKAVLNAYNNAKLLVNDALRSEASKKDYLDMYLANVSEDQKTTKIAELKQHCEELLQTPSKRLKKVSARDLFINLAMAKNTLKKLNTSEAQNNNSFMEEKSAEELSKWQAGVFAEMKIKKEEPFNLRPHEKKSEIKNPNPVEPTTVVLKPEPTTEETIEKESDVSENGKEEIRQAIMNNDIKVHVIKGLDGRKKLMAEVPQKLTTSEFFRNMKSSPNLDLLSTDAAYYLSDTNRRDLLITDPNHRGVSRDEVIEKYARDFYVTANNTKYSIEELENKLLQSRIYDGDFDIESEMLGDLLEINGSEIAITFHYPKSVKFDHSTPSLYASLIKAAVDKVTVTSDQEIINEDQQIAIFHFIKEAIINSISYSESGETRVHMSLVNTPQGQRLEIKLEDGSEQQSAHLALLPLNNKLLATDTFMKSTERPNFADTVRIAHDEKRDGGGGVVEMKMIYLQCGSDIEAQYGPLGNTITFTSDILQYEILPYEPQQTILEPEDENVNNYDEFNPMNEL